MERLKGLFLVLLACLVLCGCKTVRYVPVETVRTDSVYVDRWQRDSVYVRDSVWVNRWTAGDTVYIPQGSPHRMCLQHLSDEIVDTIYIIGIAYTNPEKLAEGVAAGRVKHTIVHEQLARKLVREHRNLDASLPVSLEQPGCWAVNKQSADLLAELNNFLDRFVGSLEYWRLYREYY